MESARMKDDGSRLRPVYSQKRTCESLSILRRRSVDCAIGTLARIHGGTWHAAFGATVIGRQLGHMVMAVDKRSSTCKYDRRLLDDARARWTQIVCLSFVRRVVVSDEYFVAREATKNACRGCLLLVHPSIDRARKATACGVGG
ncbi:unnamed protein product [Soboliphyme baturini]|uniref:Transposase n=1 Tax=Soboliphyme baturini TaxID=241478 RepID=A0A183JA40_9BILA|nr:unnamed protein product [Soboliphyme baturini]